jgi:site-specific recombinase XerD
MVERFYTRSRGSENLSGPIGPYLTGFVCAEREVGFTPLTVRYHLRAITALNRWLKRSGIGVADLSEAKIEEFLRRRRSPEARRRHERSPLNRLLAYLREGGATRPRWPDDQPNPRERLLRQFVEHLTKTRGLLPSTSFRYVSVARCFLRFHGSSRSMRFSVRQAKKISSFVVKFMRQRGRKAAKELVSGLRAFLRWLQFRGGTSPDVLAAVPSVADWRLSSVPQTLTAQEVRRLLQTCDRRTVLGRRDFAIILLLARLGLRAGEVVRLELQDVDWRAGEILLRRKPGREDRLPLPPDVGGAHVAYLRRGRPVCSERRFFLCMNAPYRPFGISSRVTDIVNCRLPRAGGRRSW